MKVKKPLTAETQNAQALGQIDEMTGGLTPSIHPASTFVRDSNYQLTDERFSYGRDGCPNYVIPERVLCELESASDALLFGSGMAAAMAIIQSLKPGDHIVIPRVMYWGLRNWLLKFCRNWGLELDLYDASSQHGLEEAVIKGKTKLVWIETPSNPTWEIIDIEAAAEIAHQAGARLVADSTVATPVLTQPIKHGADIVMHSATKYLNGHCDIVAGALATARKDEFWQRICEVRAESGSILGSFEAWLLQRGMRTLFLRVQRASESALIIARHFENHSAIKQVLYPGLSSHPGHSIARKQMTGGFSGMLSVRVTGGAQEALAVARQCKVFKRATSLGGIESLVEHRYTIEGPDSPIPKDLLRLSIGIESVEDLIQDLEQSL
jgi:cystathionine gamma-synthase